jgi:hypothetical protein
MLIPSLLSSDDKALKERLESRSSSLAVPGVMAVCVRTARGHISNVLSELRQEWCREKTILQSRNEDNPGIQQQESDGAVAVPMVRASYSSTRSQTLRTATACHSSRVRVCVALHVNAQIHTVELLEEGQSRVT